MLKTYFRTPVASPQHRGPGQISTDPCVISVARRRWLNRNSGRGLKHLLWPWSRGSTVATSLRERACAGNVNAAGRPENPRTACRA